MDWAMSSSPISRRSCRTIGRSVDPSHHTSNADHGCRALEFLNDLIERRLLYCFYSRCSCELVRFLAGVRPPPFRKGALPGEPTNYGSTEDFRQLRRGPYNIQAYWLLRLYIRLAECLRVNDLASKNYSDRHTDVLPLGLSAHQFFESLRRGGGSLGQTRRHGYDRNGIPRQEPPIMTFSSSLCELKTCKV